MRNNNYQTAKPPYEAELIEEETPYLSISESMTPDLHMLKGGDLSERQEAVVEEGAIHLTAQDVQILKDLKAFDNLMRFNEYMREQFTSAMIRSDYTEARAHGRPCEDVVKEFMKQRRGRVMLIADKVEERAALKQLNEAGKDVYPKPKRDDNKLNLILRFLTSEKTKITQAKDQDDGLPVMKGSFFGTGID